MSQTWRIMDPTAEVKKARIDLPSIPDLSGKVVGFVSNEVWTCLPTIWKKLGEVLQVRYNVGETFQVAIPASHQSPAKVLDDVAARSDAAIVGLAN